MRFSQLHLENRRNFMLVDVPYERGVMHLFGLFETKQPKIDFQSERGFSDGTIRLIGLIRALLDADGSLLLEEPELSLHQGVVRHLPGKQYCDQKVC